MSDKKPVVVVVEDEPELRLLLGLTLAAFDVRFAGDGEEGLALARALLPDAIVTDVVMPKLSGEGLVAALKLDPTTREIPILILTAKPDIDFRARMLTTGAEDFVPKPFSPIELLARVRNAVSRKRTRDVLRAALENKDADVERLARDLAARRRELEAGLAQMSVARDQAERASELKSNFLDTVSHELRTPLTSMRLLVERLARDASALPPRTSDLVGRIEVATARMTKLVDSLLEYARIERDRMTIEIVPIDPDAIARDVVDEHRAAADEKGLTMAYVLRGDGVAASDEVRGDPKLLRAVLSNLVANAIRFTERGEVVVAYERGATRYAFAVEDTGVGVGPNDLEAIFEPFKQLEPLRHKHAPGFGLGLALVRDVVRSLGGEIEVASVVGKGSTFRASFPR